MLIKRVSIALPLDVLEAFRRQYPGISLSRLFSQALRFSVNSRMMFENLYFGDSKSAFPDPFNNGFNQASPVS